MINGKTFYDVCICNSICICVCIIVFVFLSLSINICKNLRRRQRGRGQMINGTTFCPALFCSHIQAADEIQMVEQNAVKYPAFNRSEYFLANKELANFLSKFSFGDYQGGRSCAKARRAFAEEFGLRRKS